MIILFIGYSFFWYIFVIGLWGGKKKETNVPNVYENSKVFH